MNQEIINKIDELIEEIKNWPKMREIKKLDLYIENNYCKQLKTFQIEKEKFAEVFQYGKHHPDYQRVLISFGNAKEDLYSKEEVRKYFILVEEVRQKLQEMMDLLAITISPIGFKKGGHICVTK